MTAIQKFELVGFLDRLEELRPECVQEMPFSDLEWILADFVLSWGQRLPISPGTCLSEGQRLARHDFGKIYLPFSTASDFPAVTSSQVRVLALASSCLTLYILLLDDIVDEPMTSPIAAKVAIQPLLFHAYRLLNQLFPVDSPFWNEAERFLNMSSRGILEQYEMYKKPMGLLSEGEFKRIAHNIMAFARVNCVALATMNNTLEYIPALTKGWDAISLAAIIRDEIYDWREDYCNANYTYLLSQILLSPPFREQVESGRLPELHEIGATLFCTEIIESLYELLYQELLAAEEEVSQIVCPALIGIIREIQKKVVFQFRKLSNHKIGAMLAINMESL